MAKDESKVEQSWKYLDGPPRLKSKSLKAQFDKIERETQAQANELESEYHSVLSSDDTDKAVELLIELIYADNNTPKRRKELRELYSKQCPAGEDATEYGYLRVMEVRWGVNDTHKDNPINGAKRDYIDYLQLQAQEYDYSKDFNDNAINLAKKIAKLLKEEPDTQKNELIQWFTRSKDYDSAWEILKNSDENNLIQFAVKAFQIEYDKYKKCGNTADNDYHRVTWILASLFKKIGNIEQAIPKFIECKEFRSAYELVDLHSVDSLRFALEAFKGHDENHVKALSLMVNRHAEFEQMYTAKRLPDNFAMKWFFLNAFYAVYRVYSLAGAPAAFAVGAFTFFAAPYVAQFAGLSATSYVIVILTILTLILCNDIRLHGKWISFHQMYASIIAAVGDHPQMAPLQGKFYKALSTEAGTQKRLILVLLYFFLCMFISYVALSDIAQRAPAVQTTPTVQESVVTSKISASQSNPPLDTTNVQPEPPRDEAPIAPPNLGEHWIKDNNTDVYLWNPEPYGDERISWNGSYVQDGDYKFAEGSGTVTWYRDGQVIQVDEGSFEHGKHHGRFKHTLESGNVVYSNWKHGEEVVDTPAQRGNTDSNGQYVGTYNSGMKAYIVPGTLKVSSDRNSCNVKILAEGDAGDISYLDYRIWREGSTLKFSNSEGYSGVITSTMRVENKIWEIAQNQF